MQKNICDASFESQNGVDEESSLVGYDVVVGGGGDGGSGGGGGGGGGGLMEMFVYQRRIPKLLVNCTETMKLHTWNIRLLCVRVRVCVCVCGGEGRVLKLMTHLHLVLRLGMNGVIPSLPCTPYGIYTGNFAFVLYINGNSSIE